ncbi:GDSL-type esterase/lipase family protein [Mesorhizobium sp. M0292]|uniref:SGNH/GDSL hydrolase family protein n=1 Tax=Mesorhizobium sp. M0292 TaxID=2956929 RepID=UPI003335FBDF
MARGGFGIGVGIGLGRSIRGSSVPAPDPVFLPTLSAAPSFVIGTSKLIAAYSGPAARVQRLSDDAETDLPFGSKFMNVSTLGTGTHCFKSVYDQTGQGNHIAQAIKANQPSASNLLVNGVQPAIHFDSSPLAVGVRSKYMGTASGPTTEKSAFTMFLLLVPSFSFNDNYFACQPDNATTVSLFTSSANVGIRGNNTSPFNSTRKMPLIRPQVLRWRGSSAGKQFGINGSTQLIATAPAAGTVTGIAFGRHITTASYDGEFDLMAAVIYNAALSDAECLLVEQALYAQCNVLTSANNLIIFDGDSRTEGSGHLLNQTWPKRVLNSLSKPAHAINMGIGGQLLSSMATNVAARVAANYNAAYAKNIVALGGPGINDFTAGQTAAQVQASMQTYAAGLNAGQTLVVGTVPYRSTESGTQRILYNTWLRANYASLKAGTTLVDLDAIPQFATYSTDFYADIVHFNDAGQQLWAAAMLPAIEALVA